MDEFKKEGWTPDDLDSVRFKMTTIKSNVFELKKAIRRVNEIASFLAEKNVNIEYEIREERVNEVHEGGTPEIKYTFLMVKTTLEL